MRRTISASGIKVRITRRLFSTFTLCDFGTCPSHYFTHMTQAPVSDEANLIVSFHAQCIFITPWANISFAISVQSPRLIQCLDRRFIPKIRHRTQRPSQSRSNTLQDASVKSTYPHQAHFGTNLLKHRKTLVLPGHHRIDVRFHSLCDCLSCPTALPRLFYTPVDSHILRRLHRLRHLLLLAFLDPATGPCRTPL